MKESAALAGITNMKKQMTAGYVSVRKATIIPIGRITNVAAKSGNRGRRSVC